MNADRPRTDGDGHTATPRLVLVAAVAENRVIGADGGMPWHYPADLRHFKETTMGHPVVMGRRTYESIAADVGGPLPGRTNVVLTSRELALPDGAVRADGIEDAVERAAATGADTAYVVGGATVYEQFLPLADGMVLTEVPGEPDGDTRFPAIEPDEWTEVDRERAGELAFVTYERA
jgi:dihydrofolate reductase